MISGKETDEGCEGFVHRSCVPIRGRMTCALVCTSLTLAAVFIFSYSSVFPTWLVFIHFLHLAFWSLDCSDPGLSLNLLQIEIVMDKSFSLSSAINDELHSLHQVISC